MSAPLEILNAIRVSRVECEAQRATTTKLWKDFGKSVRVERKRRKITLKFFAAQLRYTTTMIAYLEQGRRQWPLKKAELAISILNKGEAWPDARR